MADKDITIGIKTVGDTSGADAVDKAVKKVVKSAEDAQRDLDVLEAKRRVKARAATGKGGITIPEGVNLEQVVGQMTGQSRMVSQAVSFMGAEVATAATAAVLEVAAAGLIILGPAAAIAGVWKGELDSLREIEKLSKETGIELGPKLKNELATLQSMFGPIERAVSSLKEKWEGLKKAVSNPGEWLTGLDKVKESLERAKEATSKLNAERLKIANERQGDIVKTYAEELQKLKEQEAIISHISQMRSSMASLAVKGASQEVDAAKLRGGDVGLAQANLLAVSLRADLDNLGTNLQLSQAKARSAETAYNSVKITYEAAIRDGMDTLDPKNFQKLKDRYDPAKQAYDDAVQAVDEQAQLFQAGKLNILRGAENELLKLDQDTSVTVTKASEKAKKGIYQTIKNELAESTPKATEAIAQIQADTTVITTAAQTKSTEVAAAITTSKDATVAAVSALGETATAHAAAAKLALDSVGAQIQTALTLQTDATVASFGLVAATCIANASRISSLEKQQQAILSRLR